MIGTDITGGPLQELRRRGIEAYQCDETTLQRYVEPGSVGAGSSVSTSSNTFRTRAVFWNRFGRSWRPAECLIGQTPNVASFGRRFWGDLWNQWHAPQHLMLFSDRHAEAPCGEGGIRSREDFQLDLRGHAVGPFISPSVDAGSRSCIPPHSRTDVPAAYPGRHSHRDARGCVLPNLSHGFRPSKARRRHSCRDTLARAIIPAMTFQKSLAALHGDRRNVAFSTLQ